MSGGLREPDFAKAPLRRSVGPHRREGVADLPSHAKGRPRAGGARCARRCESGQRKILVGGHAGSRSTHS